MDERDDLTRLALAAGRGDRTALAAFVRESQGEVWRLCAHLGDRQRADDLTQDTYLRAIKALPRFRGDSSARTWLLRIARNTCADALRRKGRRLAALERLRAAPPPHSGDPGNLVAADALISQLDPDRQDAFVLTQLLGLPYAEVAEICSCPVGTIRSRVARAREELVDAWDTDRLEADES